MIIYYTKYKFGISLTLYAQNESQSHSSLFSIVVYYRADAKSAKSGTASPTSDTLSSAKSSKMGNTASPTTDTLSSAKSSKMGNTASPTTDMLSSTKSGKNGNDKGPGNPPPPPPGGILGGSAITSFDEYLASEPKYSSFHRLFLASGVYNTMRANERHTLLGKCCNVYSFNFRSIK